MLLIGISVPDLEKDVEGHVEKILAHGGKHRRLIREYYPGEKPYRIVYMKDPFGLIVRSAHIAMSLLILRVRIKS